jgi:hypothetical protein
VEIEQEANITRIDGRFETIDGQLGELRRDVLGHFDELYRRLERPGQ